MQASLPPASSRRALLQCAPPWTPFLTAGACKRAATADRDRRSL